MLESAKLYIVATPIGNLEDITLRALSVLKSVELIAAEDTRQSKKLLNHYGINTPLFSLHAHNEKTRTVKIIELLHNQKNIAYVTDAGTPLISDPGAYLVKAVRAAGYPVFPIPGPSAVIAALSVSGFTSPHFYFEGFLPHKSSARKKRLKDLRNLDCTLVFYESTHRILESLKEMLEIFGNREGLLARELTKKFETVFEGNLTEIITRLLEDHEQRLGEFVLLLSGSIVTNALDLDKITIVLTPLLEVLPLKQAITVASRVLDVNKNELYDIAVNIKNSHPA